MTKSKILFSSIVFFAVLSSLSYANICETITAKKNDVYTFTPRTLNAEQKEVANKKMDEFWSFISANKLESIPCLQSLLVDEPEGSYFCMDGSLLLMDIDNSEESMNIILGALLKPNLDDIDHFYYLNTAFILSKRGFDIGKIAVKLLEKENINIFVPKHAMELNAYLTAMYITAAMPEKFKDDNIMALWHSKNQEIRPYALFALQYSMTERSFFLLDSIVKTKLVPDSTLSILKTFMNVSNDFKLYMDTVKVKYNRAEAIKKFELIEKIDRIMEESGGDAEKELQGIRKLLGNENADYMDLMSHTEVSKELILSAIKNFEYEDIQILFRLRDNRLRSISDESWGGYQDFTFAINQLIRRLGIYDKYLQNY